jgi:hypothetical protein
VCTDHVKRQGSCLELLDEERAAHVEQLGRLDCRQLGMHRDHGHAIARPQVIDDRYQQFVDPLRKLDGRSIRPDQSWRLPDPAGRLEQAFDLGERLGRNLAGTDLKHVAHLPQLTS